MLSYSRISSRTALAALLIIALFSSVVASAPAAFAQTTGSGKIDLENLDRLPYNDRLVFQRIHGDPETEVASHRFVTLRIHNRAATPLNVSQITITGSDADTFFISSANRGAFSIAANAFRDVLVTFGPGPADKRIQRALRFADMTIFSSDPYSPQTKVELAGFNTPSQQGVNEPTLEEMMTLFGYQTDIVSPNVGALLNPPNVVHGDEVISNQWARASTNAPVYVRQLAAFSGDRRNVPITLTNCTGCTVSHGPIDFQSILPLQASTATPRPPVEMSVTPGGNFVVVIDNQYRSDQTDPRRVRFWPVRDRSGHVVRNTYIVGQDTVGALGCRNTQTQANCDYQDNVYLISNIRPVNYADDPNQIGQVPGSPGLVLEFDQEYANTLLDRDGQGIGFPETQRNKNDAPLFPAPPTTSYDPSRLNIDPSGQGTLTVTTFGFSSVGNNTNNDNTLVNGVCLPFDGRSAKHVVSTRILGPLTNINRAFMQAGIMVGTNQAYFAKLVATVQQTTGTNPPLDLEFALETRNQQTRIGPLIRLPSQATINTLDLQLIGDPNTGTIEAAYSVNGAPFQALANKALVPASTMGRLFGGHNTGCLLTTNKGTSTNVDIRFDRFAITAHPEVNAPRDVLNGPNGQPLRFNTGGGAITVNGRTWRDDAGLFTPSNSPDEQPGGIGEIAYTNDDPIYRDYRGQSSLSDRSLTYEIPLASSDPQFLAARLHFAELFWGRSTPNTPFPNRRVFDVYAEGKLALRGVDISAMAGGALKALTVTLENIFVTDGSLTLRFVSTVDNTAIAAIEVLDTPTGAPVVDAGLDRKVNPGAAVSLAGSAVDNDPPYTYQWVQLSGAPVTLTNANALQASFTAGTTYEKLVFELRVTNAQNETGSDTVEITVGDTPVQGLTIQTNSPQSVDSPMSFVASVGAGENVTYSWNFGDGSPAATGKTVQHTYTNIGSYTVTVTASNNTSSVTATANVSVIAEQPFELRINAGGAAVTTPDGTSWSADVHSSGGRIYPVSGTPVPFDIAGTTNDIIYQTERSGINTATPFSYNIPVPAVDDYTVTLHFAEIYYTGRPNYGPTGNNRRVFNVNIEGGPVEISGLDLNAVAGPLTAYTRTFTPRVTDGTLNIQFSSTVDNAKISAIEVVRVVNQPPTVNAGPDQTVQPGTLVQLSGSASDPEGKAITAFSWTQIAGPTVSLANPNSFTPSFTPAVKGSYTFRLSATDADQVTGGDTVTIVAANRAPVVTASAAPATVNVGQASQLGASASDADNDSLTYSWAQTGGPSGGTLTGAGTATASFTPAAKGSYTFTVTVSDGDTGGTATANVTLSARNRAPVVTASATPATVDVGQASQLGASASDADNDSLTYSWAQTGGPSGGTLTGAGTATASFTPAAKGSYTFTVTVSDGDTGGTATADVTLSARNRAPAANAGPDQSVNVGASVQLSGSGSSDPDNDSLTFAWTQTGGTPVQLTGGASAAPSFFAPAQPSTLTFELVVTDSEGLASSADSVTVTVNEIAISGLSVTSSSPTVLGRATTFNAQVGAGSNVTYSWDFGDGSPAASGASVQHTYAATDSYTVRVTATNSLGSVEREIVTTVTNAAPLANPGAAQTVTVGAAVTLNGGGSSDPDGHLPLSYAWTQTGGPAVTLSSSSAASPTFTAPGLPTVLAFQLVVTDARGLASEPASVLVTARDSAPQNVNASNDGPTTLGQETTLTATASGTNLTYSWNLGDGSPAVTGATVTHTYADEGSYVATVTVSNSSGTLGTASTGVVVTNLAPLANAGADRGVDLGVAVTLNAGASSDPDGHTPLTYAWKQLSGTAVTLAGADSPSASFTAPNLPSILFFQVTVTDSRGKSASDTVRIAVGDEPIEGLQVASSGSTVLGRPTSFTASITGGTNVNYSWDFGGGSTASGASVQFTFAAEGSYPVTLTATNGAGNVSRTITVVVTNAAPTANAGADKTAQIDTLVTLVGTGADADGHTPLSYRWRQIAGTTVTLTGDRSATASFTAPSVEGQLVFELTVTDSRNKATSDTITIAVRRGANMPGFFVYLPTLANGSGGTVALPADLTISKMEVTPASMEAGAPAQIKVTVTNKGGNFSGPFWVDLYINPSAPPSAAGVTWETTCTLSPCHGIAWLVKDGLAAGKSVVLTSEATSYYTTNTRWFGSFAAGTSTIYAYADSWNLSNPAGIVAEGDETNNRGVFTLTGGTTAQAQRLDAEAPQLPARTFPAP